MHALGVGIRGAKDEITPSDDTSSICYSTRQDLVHGTSLSKDCPRPPIQSFDDVSHRSPIVTPVESVRAFNAATSITGRG